MGGIRWTFFSTLENLDFADNIVLISHNHSHMQEKTSRLSTHTMTEKFTYLGSIVREDDGAGIDMQSQLKKARNTFRMLNSVWWSSQYGTQTKHQDIPEVHLVYPFVRVRMLEDDRE